MVQRWAFLAIAFLVVAFIMLAIVSHPTIAGCIDEGAPCDYDGNENDDDGHCENGVCVPNYAPGGEISLELIADPPTITTNTDFLLIARISGIVGGGQIITYKRGGTVIGDATCGTTMDGCEAILTWRESNEGEYSFFASHDIYGGDVTVKVTPTPITCPGGTVCFDSYPRCLGNDLLTCGINDCEESQTCEYGCSGVPGQAECNPYPSCDILCDTDGWCNSECSSTIGCSEDDDCSLTICSTPRLCMSTPDIIHPPSIDVSNNYYCDAQDLLCYNCPTNAHFNGYDCQCISGYVWNDNTDSCEISCEHECYDPARTGECKHGRPDCSSGSPECVYPAPNEFLEVCDGLDNDCDNYVDENIEESWHLDNDGDDDGDPDVSSCRFEGINGNAVQNGLDCNDNEQNENSTAIEINEYCSDGFDNDCDGDIDGNDAGCTVVSCGTGECESYSTTEYIWIRVEDTCQEEQFLRTTQYSNPTCIEDECTYPQEQEEDISQNSFQNFADSESCEEFTGYCKAGLCLDPCEPHGETPGCQETTPENTEVKNNGCPPSANEEVQTCYACKKGFFWERGECQVETNKIININNLQAVSDTAFILHPVTEDFDGNQITNVKYVYSSRIINTETTEPLTIRSDKIGNYELVISAYKTTIGNKKLASKTIEISLTCPANTACCPTGSTSYAKPGMSCSYKGYAGTCNQYGSCVLQCTNPEFENTAQTCSDGRDNDCDGVYD
ncbi:hypothetical protein GOV10_02385, partial [Candidatus Woesearchaeota archaeon]|nr:hypothetical protein [Candidatus Woesearchaeota archaeon]